MKRLPKIFIGLDGGLFEVLTITDIIVYEEEYMWFSINNRKTFTPALYSRDVLDLCAENSTIEYLSNVDLLSFEEKGWAIMNYPKEDLQWILKCSEEEETYREISWD